MGGGSKRPKIQTPEEPAPTPLPVPGREEEEAKKKARNRSMRTGRESTRLAGQMMANRNGTILKTRTGD